MNWQQTLRHKFAKSSLWLAFLLALLIGLYVTQFNLQPLLNSWWWISFSLLIFLPKRGWLALFAVLIVGMQLGLWRGSAVNNQLAIYNKLFGHKIAVTGTVSDDPAYVKDYNGKTQYEFHMDHLQAGQTNKKQLPGSLRVRTQRGVSLKRGYRVKVSGRINATLSKKQAGAISYANVDIISMHQSAIEHVRQRFISGIYSSLPEPAASLGLGYLIGIRSSIPATLTLALVITGLTHIVAVSGYNLTIIIQAVRRLFGKLSRYQNLLASLTLIALFVICTGNNPSIARATVISVLGLLGWYYGREFKPLILILWGAVITGWLNPTYVWGNVGWYLSFLAFVGILLIAPIIRQIFFGQSEPKLVGSIILETICAQLLTFPYIIAIFGKVSLIALLANVLVLPLIPLAMLATLLAGIAGAIIPAYAGWLAWPAHWILQTQIFIIDWLSRVPWAQINFSLQPTDAIVIYAGLFLVTLIYLHKHPEPLATSFAII